MTQRDINEMASECGLIVTPPIEAFAKLVAAKEREKWKEIVEDQRLRLQALNEIIGGEDSTTTGNILSYSRWEMRLEDAVKAEREACHALRQTLPNPYTHCQVSAHACDMAFVEYGKAIRARGEA